MMTSANGDKGRGLLRRRGVVGGGSGGGRGWWCWSDTGDKDQVLSLVHEESLC